MTGSVKTSEMGFRSKAELTINCGHAAVTKLKVLDHRMGKKEEDTFRTIQRTGNKRAKSIFLRISFKILMFSIYLNKF